MPCVDPCYRRRPFGPLSFQLKSGWRLACSGPHWLWNELIREVHLARWRATSSGRDAILVVDCGSRSWRAPGPASKSWKLLTAGDQYAGIIAGHDDRFVVSRGLHEPGLPNFAR